MASRLPTRVDRRRRVGDQAVIQAFLLLFAASGELPAAPASSGPPSSGPSGTATGASGTKRPAPVAASPVPGQVVVISPGGVPGVASPVRRRRGICPTVAISCSSTWRQAIGGERRRLQRRIERRRRPSHFGAAIIGRQLVLIPVRRAGLSPSCPRRRRRRESGIPIRCPCGGAVWGRRRAAVGGRQAAASQRASQVIEQSVRLVAKIVRGGADSVAEAIEAFLDRRRRVVDLGAKSLKRPGRRRVGRSGNCVAGVPRIVDRRRDRRSQRVGRRGGGIPTLAAIGGRRGACVNGSYEGVGGAPYCGATVAAPYRPSAGCVYCA